jgi:antitoxin component YwqK of YwqJK toxin-antitoxin module
MNQTNTKRYMFILWILSSFVGVQVQAQNKYRTFQIGPRGDTINAILQDGNKEGKWVIRVEEVRGEPGYEEEGEFKKGQKDGYWRRYSLMGDLVAVEHFMLGGKDGLQQYFTELGDLEHEESWKGYNPDAPYDTIAIYGSGSNEIIDYKIVKAEPYSVKDGEWKYYEPGSGRLIRTEKWERNVLANPNAQAGKDKYEKPKKVEKTAEMLEWERKNKGKKKALRDGQTGM